MTALFRLKDYNLDATLDSGQAFRWRGCGPAWEGIVQGRWVRLQADADGIRAELADPVPDWRWLEHYLALDEELAPILAQFPDDEPLRVAVAYCRGLRLLRQDPWECLASFILSSTKQIVQIRQCVSMLSHCFGDPVAGPPDSRVGLHAFPTASRLAQATESDLRACKLGFRARYLSVAAQRVSSGELDLAALSPAHGHTAREALVRLPGVGPKIANCVLLFAYGRQDAFPVDVWVQRALRELYFPGRRPSPRRLDRLSARTSAPMRAMPNNTCFTIFAPAPLPMIQRIEVLLTPSEFASLPARDLSGTVCVVFDVLRATSTMLQALAAGAESILPVKDIPTALDCRRREPSILLAGEREGLRIGAELTGGVEFDLGNSPREFSVDRVRGRRLVMTTSNGTRAIEACRGADAVLICSFGNLTATLSWLRRRAATHLLVVCAGTLDHSAWEDVLGAGALVDRLWDALGEAWVDDSARVVREVYRARRGNLVDAAGEGRNGRRLLSLPELAEDIPLCFEADRVGFAALLGADGCVRCEPPVAGGNGCP